MRYLCFSWLLFFGLSSVSQTLGGDAAFQFLKLPATPQLTALGGINASYKNGDAGLAANNPALLPAALHGQLQSSFTALPGGVKGYALTGAYHLEKHSVTLGGHINFINYGSLPATDAAGNISGDFRPVDFVAQLSVSGRYLERWMYGATIKFIQSSYGIYRSNALAVDVGVLYADTGKGFTASLLIKNMGTQLKTYAGQAEDLPFDLQLGVSKKLAKAPLGFSVTANQLHRFDVGYNDTTFNNENGFASSSGINQFFNHFTAAAHVYMGQLLEASFGYSHLRRQDLRVDGGSSGLAGFSAGLQIRLKGLQIIYARSGYQKGIAYNQIGLGVDLTSINIF